MKSAIRFLSLILTVTMSFSLLCSCKKTEDNLENSSNSSSTSSKEYDISFYNYKPEAEEFFKDICSYYEGQTGVKVKFIQASKDKTNIENIRALVKSNEAPNIFTIQGLSELKELENDNIVLNFNKASKENFKEFINEIPDELRLSYDNYSNYGIPYDVEGYGYLVDKKMLVDLFELDDVSSILQDLKESSYDEFCSFCLAINDYIKDNVASSIVLNGNKYSLAQSKAGLSNNLDEVFSTAGLEPWTYTSHMLNIALCSQFESQKDLLNTSQIDSLKDIITKYAKSLDFETSYSTPSRGKNYPQSAKDYSNVIADFTNSKALFINQGNWAYNDIKANNEDLAKRTTIIPIKLPLEESDIRLEDSSLEDFNSSIPIYVPMYYSINSNSTELELKLAEEFLIWLNTAEYPKSKMIEDYNMIPSNISTYYQLNNNLNNDILSYKKSGHYLPAAYLGTPYSWNETLGNEIKENYFTKNLWSKEDYEAIADFAVSKWKELKK